MNEENVHLMFEEGIDEEAISQFSRAFSQAGKSIDLHKISHQGSQASILLLAATSIGVIFFGAFIKKLGDKAAEDFYPILKSSLVGIYKKYFGNSRKYNNIIISSSPDKSPETIYSLDFALYCKGKNEKEKIKFLYELEWTQEEFDEATREYLLAMVEFLSNDSGKIRELIDGSSSKIFPALIALNAESKTLIKVNSFPEHINI